MNPPIGFILLINPFNPLVQTERLIGVLNRMFDFPPIACHFDFGQNSRTIPDLPQNVKIVRPHVNTKWADFSCIEAAIACVRILYQDEPGPDWFVYLSGADFPCKSAERIHRDLQNSPFDAHIEHLLLSRDLPDLTVNDVQGNPFKGGHWRAACIRRYCSLKIRIPWLTKRLAPTRKTFTFTTPLIARWLLPFSEKFQPYAGEAWWCANRRAAKAILDFHATDRVFAEFCRRVEVPEECYFQTVLANSANLKIGQNHLRFMNWKAHGNNPKVLGDEDISDLTKTSAHFARKFPEPLPPALAEFLTRAVGLDDM